MNTILDQGILGHPTSQRTYWSSSVNMNAVRWSQKIGQLIKVYSAI